MITRISSADLHTRIGNVLTRIQRKGERFVIERRGIPVAAVISIEDLQRLEFGQGRQTARADRLNALAMADAVRTSILAERNGVPLPNSSILLNELRKERDNELAGLH
jgi:antitoxin (DNA-binding transcriptional repressor) of toxin-antitoxin stability system